MKISSILKDIEIMSMSNYKNYNVKTITHISKDVLKSGMFICLSGENFDGNDFVEEAIIRGAKCIVSEKTLNIKNVTTIQVKDVRKTMSLIAKNFYNRCVDDMDIIGIVGTSGKTTTSLIISKILSNFDNNIGVIGTNGIFIGNIRLQNTFTTPDPLELHYVFYQMKMLGVKTVIMEVSAQAIYLKKMYGIKLRIGVFTNISEEHLDFFGSMENYAKCKMNYFNNYNMKECVVNTDDFYGRELALKLDIPCVSYGIDNPANSFAIDILSSLDGLEFTVNIIDDVIGIKCKLCGNYNVYNILAALTVCKLLGLSIGDIKSSVRSIDQIPGRLNVWKVDEKKIIVDFAHTPDSIDKLLSFLRSNVLGKIVSVFGCVGYSDREKKISMTKAVDKYSDYIIVTTDNRGKVAFDDIAKDIMGGIVNCPFECIEDRKNAISEGYRKLNNNDTLVIIGKGAEDFQKINDERIPYSDIDCVKDLLNREG